MREPPGKIACTSVGISHKKDRHIIFLICPIGAYDTDLELQCTWVLRLELMRALNLLCPRYLQCFMLCFKVYVT